MYSSHFTESSNSKRNSESDSHRNTELIQLHFSKHKYRPERKKAWQSPVEDAPLVVRIRKGDSESFHISRKTSSRIISLELLLSVSCADSVDSAGTGMASSRPSVVLRRHDKQLEKTSCQKKGWAKRFGDSNPSRIWLETNEFFDSFQHYRTCNLLAWQYSCGLYNYVISPVLWYGKNGWRRKVQPTQIYAICHVRVYLFKLLTGVLRSTFQNIQFPVQADLWISFKCYF